MPSDDAKQTETLGPVQVLPAIKARLGELQQAVRDANHRPPSQALLLSALIYVTPLDGEQLETEILGPYRRDHPAEDKPQ